MLITVSHKDEDFDGSVMANLEGGNNSRIQIVFKVTQGIEVFNTFTHEVLFAEAADIEVNGMHESVGYLTLMKRAIEVYEIKSGIKL